jgi:pimeloyl-ACP methyl ester carboxylesterase
MQELSYVILLLVAGYLLFAAFLYFYQRRLIYYPVQPDPEFDADKIVVDNDGTRLHGWVLNPGKDKAVIYFGGNSELISHRADFFASVFEDYSIYLMNYRGYGNSEGSPSEAGLFSDSLAIYDSLRARHDSITAYGRSLGSGVAVYLAAMRPLERLILLTPYDSITELARRLYPMFPVRYLLKDRFDSAARAPDISVPVLITSAEQDREIGLEHTLALRQRFVRARVVYQQIAGAAHNDIVEFTEYRELVGRFIAGED